MSTCLDASPALAAAAPTSLVRPHGPSSLSPRSAFYLQASITLTFLAGSSAPTPLYAVYQTLWGFSSTMLTLAFGVYALAVLAALLVAGRLSDHVGRRPVLIAAAAVQALTMVVFATAGGLPDLLLGRVLQGLSAGAALAAVGAGLLDLDKARGAVANAVAPMLGTALGGVTAGLMVQFLPAPTHLVYAVLGAVFVMQGIGVLFIAETAALHGGALASLRPRLSIPPAARVPLLMAAPVIVAVWALAGFYASLGPTLVHRLSAPGGSVLGGLALFVLAGSGALAVLLLQQRTPHHLMRIGALGLIVGLWLTMAGLNAQSIALFLVGTAIAGTGFGTGFQGALRSVIAVIAPQERASVLSVLFVVAYLAMGLPAIVAGHQLAQRGDIVVIAQAFGAAVMALAGFAIAAGIRKT